MRAPKFKTVLPTVGKGSGWKPELPDHRDIPLKAKLPVKRQLPPVVELDHEYLPEVRDQGELGSCTGQSVTGALMYKLNQLGRPAPLSALHAYYEARKLQNWITEDSGAYIRDAVKGAGKVGVSSAWAWPYDPSKFAKKPPALAYKSAGWHQAVGYYACTTIDDIMNALANDLPVVGGFTCFSNMNAAEVNESGVIPMPGRRDRPEGGHAVWFVKADQPSRMLVFQNSWGKEWGDNGYGCLPFEYVEQGLADDFWGLSHEP